MSPDIGLYLKQLRVSRNLTLKSISHKTKIRESILEDIENGVALEAPALIQKSYIKSFSQVVGANPQDIQSMLQVDPVKNVNKSKNSNIISSSLKTRMSISKLGLSFALLCLFSLVWFVSRNQIKVEETASYSSQPSSQTKRYQSLPHGDIKSLLNSPNPFSDRNK